MALEDFFEPFVMQVLTEAEDGLGGRVQIWTDGAEFLAGLSTNHSTEARIAYQNGMKTLYTLVTDTGTVLRQDDRMKRVRDGLLYRITSHSADMTTPHVAQRQYAQVSAEVVRE